jgi:hypothetical protein
MNEKKTKTKPARNVTQQKNYTSNKDFDNLLSLEEEEYWESVAGGAEKRERKKKIKMKISGKSVLKLKDIIVNKNKKSFI